MKYAFIALVVATTQTFAQTAPTEFPADAAPLSATAMQDSFSGKIYSVKLPNGTSWKWDFRSDGYFYFSTSDGFSDTGKWSIKETKLCTEGRKINASCNEIRQNSTGLNYKRDNGEIIMMTVQ